MFISYSFQELLFVNFQVHCELAAIKYFIDGRKEKERNCKGPWFSKREVVPRNPEHRVNFCR